MSGKIRKGQRGGRRGRQRAVELAVGVLVGVFFSRRTQRCATDAERRPCGVEARRALEQGAALQRMLV